MRDSSTFLAYQKDAFDDSLAIDVPAEPCI